jgi:nitrogenase-associated protein
MARVTFYEKPGCITNGRQKAMLAAAGHELDVRNVLAEPWTAQRLSGFFGNTPVTQWFNRAAPRVKSGEIDPARTDGDNALALMLDDPLLIRRPLMECGDWRCAGFDALAVDEAIGLALDRTQEELHPLDGCAHEPVVKRAETVWAEPA